jgi:prepilin-type N-terminal cleavage/methylation domain-containing protein/prepilin-type processing-associated H-X9-DG protein
MSITARALRGHRSARRALAFTLIELLVVVAIIALLIAILLPALRAARDQGKRAVCAANMSSIGKSMVSYFIERDSIPIMLCGTPPGNVGWCTWSYGGWVGKNTAYWQTNTGGIFYWTTDKRPLSVYMTKGAVQANTEMPVFRCPSDTVELIHLLHEGAGQAFSQFNSYDDVGTSYRLNYHWHAAYWQYFQSLPGCPLAGWQDFAAALQGGQSLFKRYAQRSASRFIIVNEETANFGFLNHERVIGFHRKFSSHNFAFLDGHVEFLKADTSQLSAYNWTVKDEEPIRLPCSMNPY